MKTLNALISVKSTISNYCKLELIRHLPNRWEESHAVKYWEPSEAIVQQARSTSAPTANTPPLIPPTSYGTFAPTRARNHFLALTVQFAPLAKQTWSPTYSATLGRNHWRVLTARMFVERRVTWADTLWRDTTILVTRMIHAPYKHVNLFLLILYH